MTIQISVKSFDPGWVLSSALRMTISVVSLRFEESLHREFRIRLSHTLLSRTRLLPFSAAVAVLNSTVCLVSQKITGIFISFCSSSLTAAFPGVKSCQNRKFTYDALFFLSRLQSKICLPLLTLQRLQVVVFAFVLSLQL